MCWLSSLRGSRARLLCRPSPRHPSVPKRRSSGRQSVFFGAKAFSAPRSWKSSASRPSTDSAWTLAIGQQTSDRTLLASPHARGRHPPLRGPRRQRRVPQLQARSRAECRGHEPEFYAALRGRTYVVRTRRHPADDARHCGGTRSVHGQTAPASRTFRGSDGPTYIYECRWCGKRFKHKTRDSGLRPHKTPQGWACSGRMGRLVDTKY